MLLSLGIGSQIGIMEGMIGTLFDIPQLKHIKKPILTGKYEFKNATSSFKHYVIKWLIMNLDVSTFVPIS
jgi:hypothetical protein